MDLSDDDAWGLSRAWPDRAIADLAARQRAVVSNDQLRALGVAPRTIGEAVTRGRLHRLHRGIYALVPRQALPPLAAEQAALLACGPEALLSHETAGRLHGLLRTPTGDLHVTVPASSDRGRHRTGIVLHRTTVLHPCDRARIGRLPLTAIARTVIDLLPTCDPRQAERLVDQALKRVSRAKLAEMLDRHPRRPGAPLLRELLAGEPHSTDTWSVAEERLLALIRRAGLPEPEVNVPLGDYVPDLMWREQQVIVEFDSYAHHSSRAAFRTDRDRHNALTSAGWQIIHITWQQLTAHPEQVLVWIATALAHGRRTS